MILSTTPYTHIMFIVSSNLVLAAFPNSLLLSATDYLSYIIYTHGFICSAICTTRFNYIMYSYGCYITVICTTKIKTT